MVDKRALTTPETVRDLARALDRYARDAMEGISIVASVEFNASATIDEAIDRGRSRVDSCLRTLQACESQSVGEGESAPDCSAQAHALARAEEALGLGHQARSLLDASRAVYAPARARYERAVNTINTDSQQLLAQIAKDVDTYLRMAAAAEAGHTAKFGLRATGAAAGATLSGLIADGGYVFVRGAAAGGRGASGGFDGGTGGPGECGSELAASTPKGFPSGYLSVPISLIDLGDSPVAGAGDFHLDTPPEDLEWGWRALIDVVMPAMRRGKDRSYFERRDDDEHRVGNRSYTATYGGFFEPNECVRLERRADGTFGVGNGFHRIWVAQRLGVEDIPALVGEP